MTKIERFFAENDINVLPWPLQLPNLNPIKNVWSYLQDKVNEEAVHGLDGLFDVAVRNWPDIPNEFLTDLV